MGSEHRNDPVLTAWGAFCLLLARAAGAERVVAWLARWLEREKR